jgi:hypothetical protein
MTTQLDTLARAMFHRSATWDELDEATRDRPRSAVLRLLEALLPLTPEAASAARGALLVAPLVCEDCDKARSARSYLVSCGLMPGDITTQNAALIWRAAFLQIIAQASAEYREKPPC